MVEERLMKIIIKGNKVAEDAYVIPDGEEYFDMGCFVEDIVIYHSAGWDEAILRTADIEEKTYGDFEQFVQFLKKTFEGKEIWITKLALTRIREMIREYRQ